MNKAQQQLERAKLQLARQIEITEANLDRPLTELEQSAFANGFWAGCEAMNQQWTESMERILSAK